MKLLSSESHNIAWFNLANFIARREKERALSMYKLLMHSVSDKAFAYQLEGDILLAFDDMTALDKYYAAADLYKQRASYTKAIAVYEHVAVVYNDIKILESLLDVYDILQDEIGIIHSFSRLANIAVKTNNFSVVLNRLQIYLINGSPLLQAELYGYIFFALLLYDRQNLHIETYLSQALDAYMKVADEHVLERFLSKIKVSDQFFYDKAKKLLSSLKD